MKFLEVLSTDSEIQKQYISVECITNILFTNGKILVYTNDGNKGKVVTKYSNEEELKEAVDKLSQIMGFITV